MKPRLPMEDVVLSKSNGERITLQACIGKEAFIIWDEKANIEEDDVFTRTLLNGNQEYYKVLDRGFVRGVGGMPSHYQTKVKKILLREKEETKNDYSTTVFLSYSHRDGIVADLLDSNIRHEGHEVKRDIRDVGPWKSFKEFMDTIRQQDYVITIISDAYLKSTNCMYEVSELVKDKYADKVFPIVIDDSIYNVEGRTKYVQFWEERYKKLNEQFKMLEPENSIDIATEMKKIKTIQSSIFEYLRFVADINNPKENIVDAILSKLPKKTEEIITKNDSQISLPEFDVKIVSHNQMLQGVAEVVDLSGRTKKKHENVELAVEMISGTARNVTIFDKLIDSVMRINKRYSLTVCYEESPDACHRDKVHMINRTTYPADIEGYPREFFIRYEIGSKRYEQAFELRRQGDTRYYSPKSSGYEDIVKNYAKIVEMKRQMAHDFLKSIDEQRAIGRNKLAKKPMLKFKKEEVVVRSIYGHDFKMNSDGCFGRWEIYDFDDDGLLVFTGDRKRITLQSGDTIEASELGCISFEIVKTYDLMGDSGYNMPIMYCDYQVGKGLFSKYEYIEEHGIIRKKEIVGIDNIL